MIRSNGDSYRCCVDHLHGDKDRQPRREELSRCRSQSHGRRQHLWIRFPVEAKIPIAACAKGIGRSRMPGASLNRIKATTINRYWMGTMHKVKTFDDPSDVIGIAKYVLPEAYCISFPPGIGRRCSQHPGESTQVVSGGRPIDRASSPLVASVVRND
jgi:hypothetical protein